MSSNTIYDSTIACFRALDLYIEQSNSKFLQLATQLRGRLLLWDKYSGARAKAPYRLDKRLEDFKPIVNAMISLLNAITENISASSASQISSPSATADSEDHKEEHDFSLHKDVDGLSIKQTFDKIGDKLWAEITISITELLDLTRTVRESAIANRDTPVPDTYIREDTAAFERSAQILARQRFPHARSTLTDQLASAITIRRNRLLYRREHEMKLRAPTVPDKNETMPEPQAKKRQDEKTKQERLPTATKMPPQLEERRLQKTPTVLTGVSKPSKSVLHKHKAPRVAASSIVGRASRMDQDIKSMYPPLPPADIDDKAHATCPYCFSPLNLPMTEDKWRAHIDKDLEVYICLSEKCADPVKFFKSSADWTSHMLNEHGRLWPCEVHLSLWYCDIEHKEGLIFSTSVQFENHLFDEHKDKLTKRMDVYKRRMRKRGDVREIGVCPFCEGLPDKITPSIAISTDLIEYIASHLRSLALLSLPVIESDEQAQSVAGDSVSIPRMAGDGISEAMSRQSLKEALDQDTDEEIALAWELEDLPVIDDLDEDNVMILRIVSRKKNPINLEWPPPLPEGWVAHLDDKTGQYYYIHAQTRSTQWEFPYDRTPLETDATYVPISGEERHQHIQASFRSASEDNDLSLDSSPLDLEAEFFLFLCNEMVDVVGALHFFLDDTVQRKFLFDLACNILEGWSAAHNFLLNAPNLTSNTHSSTFSKARETIQVQFRDLNELLSRHRHNTNKSQTLQTSKSGPYISTAKPWSDSVEEGASMLTMLFQSSRDVASTDVVAKVLDTHWLYQSVLSNNAKARKSLDSRTLYDTAWIVQSKHTRSAALLMLEERHDEPKDFFRGRHDVNEYDWGICGGCNIVLASQTHELKESDSITNGLAVSLPHLSFYFSIGTALGAPQGSSTTIIEEPVTRDIRIGDVVVGVTTGIDIDAVKEFERPFCWTSLQSVPPKTLAHAVAHVYAETELASLLDADIIDDIYPGYEHPKMKDDPLWDAWSRSRFNAGRCNPAVHFGAIAGIDSTKTSQQEQDDFIIDSLDNKSVEPLCFDPTPASHTSNLRCLVIRGIDGYVSIPKSDSWQQYAALAAAIYARVLLTHVQGMEHGKIEDVTAQSTETIYDCHQEIVNWLRPFDHLTYASDVTAENRVQSHISLLEIPRYLDWRAGKFSHLWVHGEARCGKTTLASSISKTTGELDGTIALAIYFFIQNEIVATHGYQDLLRSLIVQLEHPASRTHMIKEMRTKYNREVPSKEELETLLNNLTSKYNRVMLVIDGLDEVGRGSRPELFNGLPRLLSMNGTKWQALVLSRETKTIRGLMEQLDATELDMRNMSMNAQMSRLIDDQLAIDPIFRELDAREKEYVTAVITNRAPTIDHAKRCLRALSERIAQSPTPTYDQMETSIASLSSDLTSFYVSELSKISEHERQPALRLLNWLSYAKKVLTLGELDAALQIDIEDHAVDSTARPSFAFKSLLPGSIAKIVAQDGRVVSAHQELMDQDLMMELAYVSIKEALESLSSKAGFTLKEDEGQKILGQSCLIYLLDYSRTRQNTSDDNNDTFFPLLRYATNNWHRHLNECQIDDHSLELRLLGSDKARGDFLQLSERYSRYDGVFSAEHNRHMLSGLYCASLLGRAGAIESLLEGSDINKQEGFYSSALQAASAEGRVEVVKVLLHHKADVNAQGGIYGNALQEAAYRTSEEVVSLLLKAGADVNAQGGHLGNALQAAAYRTSEEVVSLLLKAGADVNAQGGIYGNALQAAVVRSCEEIVTLLLKAGADVNAQGGDYGNALQAAVSNGSLEISKLLLEHGADVNAQGGHYGNALQAAVVKQYLEMLKLLLDHGADANIDSGTSSSALTAASIASARSIEMVELLLDHGAKTNGQDGYIQDKQQAASKIVHEKYGRLFDGPGTDSVAEDGPYFAALQAASAGASLEVVELLFDRGAEADKQKRYTHHALQMAAAVGHERLVQLLLEAGADVSAVDSGGRTVLYFAASRGHDAAVKLLVERGSQINSQKSNGETAIYAACMAGHVTVVETLLAAGADIRISTHPGKTLVDAACMSRDAKLIRLLLEAGADMDVSCDKDGSPINVAASHGDTELLQSLLAKGVHVDRRDNSHGTALLTATIQGQDAAVEFLLRHGADPNVQSGGGMTALVAAANRGSETIVEMLLQHGADPNLTDEDGNSPLSVAREKGWHEITRTLLEYGARQYKPKTLRLKHDDYKIGWISALPIELAAAQEMLDEEHEDLEQPAGDSNTYIFGRVGKHNVVLACLPVGNIGSVSAATVAMQMVATFPAIRFGLMVGVGSGVPDRDVRLGDVVVSYSKDDRGVIQYNFRRMNSVTFERSRPAESPSSALYQTASRYSIEGRINFERYVSDISNNPVFDRKNAMHHPHGIVSEDNGEEKVGQKMEGDRPHEKPYIHYGIIASTDRVLKSAEQRDMVSDQLPFALCFDMEVAGLTNDFPCLVVRGICDYADSNKTKDWQPHAAAVAAAYAKNFLSLMQPDEVTQMRTVQELISKKDHEVQSELDAVGKTQAALDEAYTEWTDNDEMLARR